MASETLPHRLESLAGFTVESVLNDGKESGVVALLGTFPGCATGAVVKLSRPSIPLGDPNGLAGAVTLVERAPYSGMEYGYYHGIMDPKWMKSLSVDVLYPGCLVGETDENKATLLAKHVSRNTAQAPKLVRETFQMYEASHVPYITGIPSSAIGWVYKILNKEKEVERLLFDDPDPAHGFVLNVDPKWTSHAAMDVPKAEWHAKSGKNEMYMLGLCHTKEVRSLRDLRAVHLPMLRNMLAKGTEIASATYGVPPEHLRCFVHYPPQFYHFHAHFTHVLVDFGVATERAHLLEDVIENIERDGTHYGKVGLTMRMGERDGLWKRFQETKKRKATE